MVLLNIDNRLLPLAGGHLAVEQDVNLTVRPALHLGQVEVGHEEAEETSAAPHVAALAAKVCTLCGKSVAVQMCWLGRVRGRSYLWVQHVARQEDARDVDDVVATAANTGRQRSETNRGRLADNDP